MAGRCKCTTQCRRKKNQEKLSKLISRPIDKIVLMELIGQSFRSNDNKRVADQIVNILKKHGIPHFFLMGEKLLAILFIDAGKFFSDYAVPKIIKKMRADSHLLIIPVEENSFNSYLANRKNNNIKININHLSEAVLGENEALSRLGNYIEALKKTGDRKISP